MDAPIVSTVNPAEGKTSGNKLVVITGANFQLPFSPPPTGKTTPLPPSVRVTFGSKVSTLVLVVSSTELRVLVPPNGAGAVTVRVENVDEYGVVVPGEYGTKTSAYVYKRPDLSMAAPEPTLVRVVRATLQLFKEQLLENTSNTVATDFDKLTSDNLNIVEVSSLPAIVLVGPRLVENRFYSSNERRYVSDGSGGYFELPVSYTVDLFFTLLCLTDNTRELHFLMQQITQFFAQFIYLEMAVDKNDASKGTVKYELAIIDNGDMSTTTTPNESNVRQSSGEFVIRGVDLDDEELQAVNIVRPILGNHVPAGSVVEPGAYLDIGYTSYVAEEEDS